MEEAPRLFYAHDPTQKSLAQSMENVLKQGDAGALMKLITISKQLWEKEQQNPSLFWENAFSNFFPEYNGMFKSEWIGGDWKKLTLWMTFFYRRIIKWWARKFLYVREVRYDMEKYNELQNISDPKNDAGYGSSSPPVDRRGPLNFRLIQINDEIVTIVQFLQQYLHIENGMFFSRNEYPRFTSLSDELYFKSFYEPIQNSISTNYWERDDAFRHWGITRGLFIETGSKSWTEKEKELYYMAWMIQTMVGNSQTGQEFHFSENFKLASYPKRNEGIYSQNDKMIYLGNLCFVCKTPSKQQCGSCKEIVYCSQKCQQKDWEFHKKRCTKLK